MAEAKTGPNPVKPGGPEGGGLPPAPKRSWAAPQLGKSDIAEVTLMGGAMNLDGGGLSG